MKRVRSEVGGYRGRRTLNEILKWIAILLAVAVCLLLAGLFFGQEYIVFSDNGLRLELPFLEEREEPDLSDQSGNVSVIVEPDSSQEENQGEQEDEPQPPEEPDIQAPAEPVFAALELPLTTVSDGTALQKLEEAGANALILEMKGQEGTLNWVSAQTMAVSSGLNPGDPAVNDILRQWNQGEVYTVARVCCFRDNSLPYHQNSVALRATYGNWRDELGLRWLNPNNAEAQAYLAALCGELAELGFDEIWLDCWGFPVRGELGSITGGAGYGVGSFEPAMASFLSQVRQAIQPYGTALALTMERDDLTIQGAASGRTSTNLEFNADHIWAVEDGLVPELPELMTQSGITRAEERLVRLVEELTPQEIAQARLMTDPE